MSVPTRRFQVELKDMGYKSEGPTAVGEPSKQKEKVQYPGFSLSRNVPDELMGKDIGKMVRLEIVARVTGKNINTYAENEEQRVELEIVKLGVIGDAGKKTKEEYLGMDDDARAEYEKEQIESEGEE